MAVKLELHTVQTVGERETEIILYVLAAIGVLACISNVWLSVWNFTFGPPQQKRFNLALIVLAVLFITIPAVDVIQNFAIYCGHDPKHTIQFYRVGGFPQFAKENTPEDIEWRRRILTIGNLYFILKIPLMNLHVVAFYYNFKNIKRLRAYSVTWDVLVFLGFMFLLTVFVVLAYTVFSRTLMFASMIIAFAVMFIDTILFHHFAIYFIYVLSKFVKEKRAQITARMTEHHEINIEHAQKVSTSLSIARLVEKFSKGIFGSLILCGIMLWASNILFVVGVQLPFISNSLHNASSIVVALSHILMTVQLNFTLTFISTVRKMIESLSPREIRAQYEERVKKMSELNSQSNQVSNATFIENGRNLKLLENEMLVVDTSYKSSVPQQQTTGACNRQKTPKESIARSHSTTTAVLCEQPSLRSSNSTYSRDRMSSASTVLQSTPLQRETSLRTPQDDNHLHIPWKLKVTRPFVGERQDELTLRVGDIVYPNSIFDDGWAFGRCVDSFGFFPLTVCVADEVDGNGDFVGKTKDTCCSVSWDDVSLRASSKEKIAGVTEIQVNGGTAPSNYVFNGLTIIVSLVNIALAVANYVYGAQRQRWFNISLIFIAIFFMGAPVADVIQNYAFYDGNPIHTAQFISFNNDGPGDPEFEWKMTVHVVLVYFKFTMIRLLYPFSKIWDFVLVIFMTLLTIIITINFAVLGRYLKFLSIVAAGAVILIDTALFHFFAIFFIRVLKSHINATTSGQLTNSNNVSLTDSHKSKTNWVYRIFIWSGITLWVSNILWVVSYTLPLADDSQWNSSLILLKISNLLSPVLLVFTITFVKTVKGLLRPLSPVRGSYDDDEENTTDYDVAEMAEFSSRRRTNRIGDLLSNISSSRNPPAYKSQTDSESATATNGASMTRSNPISQQLPQFYSDPKRNSSDPLARMPLNLPQSQSQATLLNPPKKLRVIHQFVSPTRGDELFLKFGDYVQLEFEFNDGWGLGVSESTRLRGYFPLSCCDPNATIESNNLSPLARTLSLHSDTPGSFNDSNFPIEKLSDLEAFPEYAAPILSRTSDSEITMHVDNVTTPYQQSTSTKTARKIADPSTPPKSQLIVIDSYTPLRGDELRLSVGQTILLEKAFDDSWGFGNIEEYSGFFPLSKCVVVEK
ncbi:hypothetical protein HK098_007142 [Nowakowskiella sp. JEL0407]|nr:hypothetical protein HK098_007142 [Nowakowskiella sp. JEL0407]